MKNAEVHQSLRKNGLTVTALAARANVSRRHLGMVLANKPGRGKQVRRKVAPLLPDETLEILGWDRQGEVRGARQRGCTSTAQQQTNE